MICEKCNKEHDGNYGSGRFCSEHCARAFSTKDNREKINRKVSKALSGRKTGIKPKYIFTSEDRKKALITRRRNEYEKYKNAKFENLGVTSKKRRILKEQNYCCNKCGISKWMGNPIIFDLHHKDKNKKNNSRENLECLCPNCHSQTESYRRYPEILKKPSRWPENIITDIDVTGIKLRLR
jgi:heterodisulfide reductase subunit B